MPAFKNGWNYNMFFLGKIEFGNLRLKKPKEFQAFVQKFEGKQMWLEIKKMFTKRTDRQNAYYWLCLEIVANDIGHDPEELHDTFKAKFLVDRSGKFPVVISTTKLSTLEFGEYIDKIGAFVADFGITLPNSEDYYAREFSKNYLS